MARIPYPDIDTLSQKKRDVLSGAFGRVLNVSHVVMHAPDAFWEPQRALSRAAIFDSSIDPRERELIVLLVAILCKSEYELHHHRSLGRNAGISERELAALERCDFADFPEKERHLCDFVVQLIRDVRPDDSVLAAMRPYYSISQLFEILFIVGAYMMVARVAALTDVEIDGEAVASWS